jgi:lactate dehydrogenase-like 2-hydroxyacid dehydrogenase
VHGIQVVRVPAYSPYAVAEHAMGLILTLNRKLHKYAPCLWRRAGGLKLVLVLN